MSCINDLPEEILEKIFILTTPRIDESILISRVCKSWMSSMKRRLRLVRYIISPEQSKEYGWVHVSGRFLLGYQRDVLFYHRLVPNLMVFPIDGLCLSRSKYIFDVIKCLPNLKGIFLHDSSWNLSSYFQQLLSSLDKYKVELLAIPEFDMLDGHNPNEKCITQLRVYYHNHSYHLKGFSNLRRLQIQGGNDDFWSSMFAESPMENLEILEMRSLWCNDEDMYKLAMFCDSLRSFPKLKCLFLSTQSSFKWIGPLNGYYLHEGVEDLVLDSQCITVFGNVSDPQDLGILSIATLFPNLRNFALRSTSISAERFAAKIEGDLQLLPKLEYLEIVGPGILTDSYLTPENLISVFFKLHGRAIRCHVSDQLPKAANIFDKTIAEGFDFMKNVFPRNFEEIPMFLIEEPVKYAEQCWL